MGSECSPLTPLWGHCPTASNASCCLPEELGPMHGRRDSMVRCTNKGHMYGIAVQLLATANRTKTCNLWPPWRCYCHSDTVMHIVSS